jgi:L-fuconate dehydratase
MKYVKKTVESLMALVIHLATAAIINALLDLYAKIEGKPLWKLLVDMTSEQIVNCIDFSYITDCLTPHEALAILKRNHQGIKQREDLILESGYPACTTSTGWLGYSDEKIRKLCREALGEGWTHFKIKVGRDIDDDVRRCNIIRKEIGWDNKLMIYANQIWSVDEAIQNMNILK